MTEFLFFLMSGDVVPERRNEGEAEGLHPSLSFEGDDVKERRLAALNIWSPIADSGDLGLEVGGM